MVLEKITTTYICEKCGKAFSSRVKASECEAIPITHDKDVKVGDIVRITYGQGAGERGLVKRIDSYGDRFLLYDHYCVSPAAECERSEDGE